MKVQSENKFVGVRDEIAHAHGDDDNGNNGAINKIVKSIDENIGENKNAAGENTADRDIDNYGNYHHHHSNHHYYKHHRHHI